MCGVYVCVCVCFPEPPTWWWEECLNSLGFAATPFSHFTASLFLFRDPQNHFQVAGNSQAWLPWSPLGFCGCFQLSSSWDFYVCDFSITIIFSWCHGRERQEAIWRIILFTLNLFCYLRYWNSITNSSHTAQARLEKHSASTYGRQKTLPHSPCLCFALVYFLRISDWDKTRNLSIANSRLCTADRLYTHSFAFTHVLWA